MPNAGELGAEALPFQQKYASYVNDCLFAIKKKSGGRNDKDKIDLFGKSVKIGNATQEQLLGNCEVLVNDFWTSAKSEFKDGCTQYALKKTASSTLKVVQKINGVGTAPTEGDVRTNTAPAASRNPATIQTTSPGSTGGNSGGPAAPIGK